MFALCGTAWALEGAPPFAAPGFVYELRPGPTPHYFCKAAACGPQSVVSYQEQPAKDYDLATFEAEKRRAYEYLAGSIYSGADLDIGRARMRKFGFHRVFDIGMAASKPRASAR